MRAQADKKLVCSPLLFDQHLRRHSSFESPCRKRKHPLRNTSESNLRIDGCGPYCGRFLIFISEVWCSSKIWRAQIKRSSKCFSNFRLTTKEAILAAALISAALGATRTTHNFPNSIQKVHPS
mmetsp:Transcript_12051/g.19596  ORF Transcript_12051/g.19596 Transcript_12051/m.19596 type:complete len:123 (+) Transcript_12051:2-370(+)